MGLADTNFQNAVNNESQTSQVRISDANKFHVNFSRTNYAKHTIVNKGVKIWNSLD